MSRPPGGTAPGQPPAHYEIRVRGVLDRQWSTWFEGMAITSDVPGQTLIAGPVTDQAALHGLLAKIRDLGLPLLSVRYLGPDQ
jgi:hypothetical protein